MNRIALCIAVVATIVCCTRIAPAQADACASDLDGDGLVAGADLAVVLGSWGPCKSCDGDVNGDHFVDGIDLAFVLTRWGATCAPTLFSITPDNGPVEGGTRVYVSGDHLLSATALMIGGVRATDLMVIDRFTVAATSPPGVQGAAVVRLTAAGGEAVLTSGFNYGVVVPAWASLIEATPDPVAVPSQVLRDAITATGLAWRVRDSQSQIEMLLIPPGQYVRGASPGDSEAGGNESPPHTVTITQPFYLGRYEVTQAEYFARTGLNPSYWVNPQGPVARVSWNDAHNFATALSLRLPSEAEWEYACRAGTTGPRYGPIDDIAWYYQNSGAMTQTCGSKLANPLGLFDMLGNAREWVYDWWGFYVEGPQIDPVHVMSEAIHVVRGGSVAYGAFSASTCRASWRRDYPTSYLDGDLGFRVARNP